MQKQVAFRAGLMTVDHKYLPEPATLTLVVYGANLTDAGNQELGKMVGETVEILVSTLITAPQACREITEARKLKGDLEDCLTRLLAKFSQETSLEVEGASIKRLSHSDSYQVSLSVKV